MKRNRAHRTGRRGSRVLFWAVAGVLMCSVFARAVFSPRGSAGRLLCVILIALSLPLFVVGLLKGGAAEQTAGA